MNNLTHYFRNKHLNMPLKFIFITDPSRIQKHYSDL